jgi:hypothetical protein
MKAPQRADLETVSSPMPAAMAAKGGRDALPARCGLSTDHGRDSSRVKTGSARGTST